MIWRLEETVESPGAAVGENAGGSAAGSGAGGGAVPGGAENSTAGQDEAESAGSSQEAEQTGEESAGGAAEQDTQDGGASESGTEEGGGGSKTDGPGPGETDREESRTEQDGAQEAAGPPAGQETGSQENAGDAGEDAEASGEDLLETGNSWAGAQTEEADISGGPGVVSSSAEETWTALDENGMAYMIGENGETIYIPEPETESAAQTEEAPQETVPSGALKRTYSTAARVITETAENAGPALRTMGFNILNAVLIVFIGFQLAKLFRKMLNKAFERVHLDDSLRSFLSSIIYVLTCGITIFVALERVGVSSASIIALLGSVGLAISLSLQNYLSNFAGGVIIMVLKPFRAGDYIVCGTSEGTVAATSLFYTTLRTIDNRQIIMPNGELSNMSIINVTAEERRRLEISVTVSYQADLKKAKAILKRLFDSYPDILHEEELLIFVSELAEDGVVLAARGWIAQEKYWKAKWDLTEQVKCAYDEAGIEIPYRKMDVYIRNGGRDDA